MWNKVFEKVMEVKRKFWQRFPLQYNFQEGTCFDNWVKMLGIEEYIELFKPVNTMQFENMVLFKYIGYDKLYDLGYDLETFWYLHYGFYTECRSLVIDIEKEIIVLSPFKKFKNLGEGSENQLEVIKEEMQKASSVEISNKLDGSMISARFIPEYNRVIMAGTGSLDPENSWRLNDAYSMLSENYKRMVRENFNLTFIFEYISIKDAHVVQYRKDQEGLYLIGARDILTGRQLSYREALEFAREYDVASTEIYNRTFDSLDNDIKTKMCHEMEGFVINIDGHFVKLKTDDYTQMHKIISGQISINTIIKAVADDIIDDLIAKVPQTYKWEVTRISNLVYDYIRETDAKVRGLFESAPKNTPKEFFAFVKTHKNYARYLGCMYKGEEFNYIKKYEHTSQPSYKKASEIGIKEGGI